MAPVAGAAANDGDAPLVLPVTDATAVDPPAEGAATAPDALPPTATSSPAKSVPAPASAPTPALPEGPAGDAVTTLVAAPVMDVLHAVTVVGDARVEAARVVPPLTLDRPAVTPEHPESQTPGLTTRTTLTTACLQELRQRKRGRKNNETKDENYVFDHHGAYVHITT